jgi:hypothetical protein
MKVPGRRRCTVRNALTTLGAVLLLAAGALAEIPQVMGYQGRITDNLGNPVADGTYTMQFRIYDNSTGSGSPLWDSGSQSVALSGGVFTVMLGASPQPSLGLAFDQDYWLLVTFDGQNQTPLRRLGSVGYAYTASGLVPGTKVEGTLSGMFQAAVRGVNLVTSGPNFGLSGACYSTEGSGVFGYGAATTGTNYGVYGETDSPSGYGVYGSNTSGWAGGFDGDVDISGRLELPNLDATPTTGSGSLEVGNSLRIDGNEIITNTNALLHLQRDNNGDVNVDEGTLFVDASVNRVGVGTTAPDWKLHVVDGSAGGTAVRGDATAGTGISYGGYFETASEDGRAVYGRAANTGDVVNIGGYFAANGSQGRGVYGVVGGTTAGAAGVYGVSLATTGEGVGVRGLSYSTAVVPYGSGVFGEATVGWGVNGEGAVGGGRFNDTTNNNWAYVGYGTYKSFGAGTNSFVQNHPRDKDRVIVYAAPEGDEVATYTRGTARVVDGEARVPLGETFKWVTNPDIGLTAHLTPRGGWAELYVKSLTTKELVVASRDGAGDAAFDYIVYGLRIGFEEATIVQEKQEEAYIPSMADHREAVARHPDLREYTALERFRRMHGEVTGGGEPDLRGARTLRDAIEEYDPALHGQVNPEAEREIPLPRQQERRQREGT